MQERYKKLETLFELGEGNKKPVSEGTVSLERKPEAEQHLDGQDMQLECALDY